MHSSASVHRTPTSDGQESREGCSGQIRSLSRYLWGQMETRWRSAPWRGPGLVPLRAHAVVKHADTTKVFMTPAQLMLEIIECY